MRSILFSKTAGSPRSGFRVNNGGDTFELTPDAAYPTYNPLAPIGSLKPLLIEDWSLAVAKDPQSENVFHFSLTGSKTGTDGEGRSDARFVSNSRRIVLETNDWNVPYALSLAGITPLPDAFTVKWKVEPRFVDEFVSPGATSPGIEPW
jgi:hypothetical protein